MTTDGLPSISPLVVERTRVEEYTRGAAAGLLGAAMLAGWFFVLDFGRGQPLFTPTVLGTALFRGRDLSDIHGRDNQGRTDTEAPEHAGENEGQEIRRQRRRHRRNRKQYGGDHQHGTATEAIAERPGHEHTERCGQ